MTPSFCRHCGQPLKPGAAFCGGCGAAVTVTAAPPAAPVAHPHLPVPPPASPAAPRRGAGWVLLVGVVAILVMLGMGAGTAYVLTRDDDSPGSAGGTDDRDEDRVPADATTDVAATPTATVTVTEGATTDAAEDPPADEPETVLREAIAADADAVLALEGAWVPQLASISDDINGSWAAALEEYEQLRDFYPDALVVDTAAWPHSFLRSDTFDTVLVVLSPTPASPFSAPVLDWCRLNRGDRQTSCYAKLIETSGSPRNNTDQGEPEPEFN